MKVQPLPHDGLVEVTPDEEARWLIARGGIMVMTNGDGRRYRVLEPDERLPPPPVSSQDGEGG